MDSLTGYRSCRNFIKMQRIHLSPSTLAILKLALGAFLISFSAVFVKLVETPPLSSAFYRVFLGGLILAFMTWVRKEPIPWQTTKMIPIGLAALFFALDLSFWHQSILDVGPGLATLLGNFQVVILAVLGVLVFKERLKWMTLGSIVLALSGLAMITGFEWTGLTPNVRRGILYGLLTAVCYSGYLLSLRSARQKNTSHSPIFVLSTVSLLCGLFLLALLYLRNETLVLPTLKDGLWLLSYALISQVLGWVLITSVLAQVTPSRIGLLLLVQPTGSYLWDILFFGRNLALLEFIGIGLAILAIYMGSLASSKP